jgi:chemotaxis protein MotB
VPIVSPQYSSNWELSTARATAVVRFMVDRTAFPPERIGAVGYGEFRPIAPNDVEENRRKNRRVVFFIKPPEKQPLKTAQQQQ